MRTPSRQRAFRVELRQQPSQTFPQPRQPVVPVAGQDIPPDGHDACPVVDPEPARRQMPIRGEASLGMPCTETRRHVLTQRFPRPKAQDKRRLPYVNAPGCWTALANRTQWVPISSSLSMALGSAGTTAMSARSTGVEPLASMYASWKSCEQITARSRRRNANMNRLEFSGRRNVRKAEP